MFKSVFLRGIASAKRRTPPEGNRKRDGDRANSNDHAFLNHSSTAFRKNSLVVLQCESLWHKRKIGGEQAVVCVERDRKRIENRNQRNQAQRDKEHLQGNDLCAGHGFSLLSLRQAHARFLRISLFVSTVKAIIKRKMMMDTAEE
jgi:hypothetical protein